MTSQDHDWTRHATDLDGPGFARFQAGLSGFNADRLAPNLPRPGWRDGLRREVEIIAAEGAFVEAVRGAVAPYLDDIPEEADRFIAWFERLKEVGPGQGDPLFPWLALHARRDEVRWFLEQVVAGEAGFDDLVAMTQVKLPVEPKLELARNYWDEMGHGTAKGMHGPMLDALVETLKVEPVIENTVWESLALANAMTAMATNRRYAWHSVGALGVIELTAPGRAALVAEGLKRVGLSPREARYFSVHAVLDVKHSIEWNKNAIRPAVEEDPRTATAMAEGALIRLKCGERCFEAYREALWKDKIALAD
jgi:hypothetical protein